jgi:hypothetical protein
MYPSKCGVCHEFYEEGTEIWLDEEEQKWGHVECVDRKYAEEEAS